MKAVSTSTLNVRTVRRLAGRPLRRMQGRMKGMLSPTREERLATVGYDYESQETTPVTACNLCGSDQWTVVTHQDRYGFPAQATTCGRCGLTVLNPQMTREAYGRFYNGIYRPLVRAYHGHSVDMETRKAKQEAYAVEMERLLGPYLVGRDGQTFLDVGGSTGVVAIHFARRYNLKPVILDPAAEELAEAQAQEVEAIGALVEDWHPGDRSFGIIGMFQTIDHLLDVTATLCKLRSVIAEDGIFVVDIADFRASYLKNWSVEMALKIDHPYALTEATAEAYLARAGFDPIRKAYSADHHLVAYLCRPCAPDPGALPPEADVHELFQEMRYVQNAPRPARHGAGA